MMPIGARYESLALGAAHSCPAGHLEELEISEPGRGARSAPTPMPSAAVTPRASEAANMEGPVVHAPHRAREPGE
jgi:hypothetical protein